MGNTTPEMLRRYARDGYNRVPISRRVLADLDTPLSAYMKLAAQPYTYLLESVEGGEKWGRYSIIGLPARTVLKVHGNEISIIEDGTVITDETVASPFDYIREFQRQFKTPPNDDDARFSGGLVGYFGYDAVRYVEKRLTDSTPTDSLGTPDILLMVSERFLVFDNLKGEISLVCYVDPRANDAIAAVDLELSDLIERLDEPLTRMTRQASEPPVQESDFDSGFGEGAFLDAVEKIKNYIVDGDVMQVVLSQRMSTALRVPPINVYRALRHLNPSPYLFYLDLGDFQIVGSSPEILVRVEGRTVTTRPLAGTRPRGKTPEEDLRLEAELMADPKEIAEHLMLIDLGRNDISRVAKTGTVKVTEQMVIERYSHVMHISSNVEGELADGKDALDVLSATLPVGTLSGAPKIRAMQIIDELEPVKRGVYGGAVGYLSWNGNMDTAIAIRTAVIKDGKLYIQAGCGVVADSVPENEWQETLNKGRAMFRAVAMAADGLRHPE